MNNGLAEARILEKIFSKQYLMSHVFDSFGRLPVNPASVIVGVSGGPDSILLMDTLVTVRNELLPQLNIIVAHMDYGLRGMESDADREFVVEEAKRRDVKIEVRQASQKSPKENTQDWARRERFQMFRELLKEQPQPGVIALAHHLDDHAEGILLRLTRGGNFSTVGAMQEFQDNVWRPFLKLTKKNVLAAINLANISFRTDSSNSQSYYSRNKLRHEVLPVLDAMHQGVAEKLVAFGDELAALSSFVKEVLRDKGFDPHSDRLAWQLFTSLDRPLQRFVLYEFVMTKVDTSLPALNRENLDRWIAEAQDAATSKKFQYSLSNDLFLEFSQGNFWVSMNRPDFSNDRFKQHEAALLSRQRSFWLEANIPIKTPYSEGICLLVLQNQPGFLTFEFFCSNQSLIESTVKSKKRSEGEKKAAEFPFTWDYVKVYRGGLELGRFHGESEKTLEQTSINISDGTRPFSVKLCLVPCEQELLDLDDSARREMNDQA